MDKEATLTTIRRREVEVDGIESGSGKAWAYLSLAG